MGMSLLALLLIIPVTLGVVVANAIPFILEGTVLPPYFYMMTCLQLCVACGLVFSSLCGWRNRVLAGSLSLTSAVATYEFETWMLPQMIPP